MPDINIIALIVAALIPNILGALYYGKIMNKQWLSSIGKTNEEMDHSNPAVVYGGALILSFIAAFFIKFIIESVHKDVNSSGDLIYATFGTFGHGALHGGFLCLGLVMPVVVSLGLFHKAKGSNIIINVLFWVICFSIMGGILDAWR